ncbi:hypothetical protein Hanom_Chr08g00694871 [Helianthus anomalus]
MDEVNKLDKNDKTSNLLDKMRINKPLDESRKSGQNSGAKMTFYSNISLTSYILFLT